MASIDDIDQLRDALYAINDDSVRIAVSVHGAKHNVIDKSFDLTMVPTDHSWFLVGEKKFGKITLSILDPEKE